MRNGLAALGAVDLFAGPGGWDLAARDLGLDPLGIEYDAAAVATRTAAGLRTIHADVGELDPLALLPSVDVVIGSPPCPTFSTAGKRHGLRDFDAIAKVARRLSSGSDTRAEVRETIGDPQSLLVVEPLRWALALRASYVALEQVPTVLPLWEIFAEEFARNGYRTWVGKLKAEQFGVPQTRERAFLLAARGPVRAPTPTHQRYVYPRVKTGGESLFDVGGERDRVVAKGEASLLPWVSMAEALDLDPPIAWTADRPATVIQGDPRVFSPGGHIGHDGRDNSKMVGRSANAIRVSLDQAAVLQGFPANYPFQGTKSQQFQQVGNAVPPPLARAVLATLLAE